MRRHKIIFLASDPRGYEVILTNECWYNHILVEHPEVRGQLDDVKRAIQTPDYIYESKRRRSSHLYFLKVGRRPSRSESEYVLVVAAVRQRTRRGYVQTAFLVDGLSKGGKLLWKKP